MRFLRRRHRHDPLVCREFVELVTDYSKAGSATVIEPVSRLTSLNATGATGTSRTCGGW